MVQITRCRTARKSRPAVCATSRSGGVDGKRKGSACSLDAAKRSPQIRLVSAARREQRGSAQAQQRKARRFRNDCVRDKRTLGEWILTAYPILKRSQNVRQN